MGVAGSKLKRRTNAEMMPKSNASATSWNRRLASYRSPAYSSSAPPASTATMIHARVS